MQSKASLDEVNVTENEMAKWLLLQIVYGGELKSGSFFNLIEVKNLPMSELFKKST